MSCNLTPTCPIILNHTPTVSVMGPDAEGRQQAVNSRWVGGLGGGGRALGPDGQSWQKLVSRKVSHRPPKLIAARESFNCVKCR